MKEQYHGAYLYKRIVQAKLFIDANYAQQINLNDIADEACFSKFHFIRTFKSVYGKTPHQYLINTRIERAMELLRKGLPVTEVCWMIGFESQSSFSHLFRKIVGSSPSVYMQLQQEMKKQLFHQPLVFIPGCFAEKKGWKKE